MPLHVVVPWSADGVHPAARHPVLQPDALFNGDLFVRADKDEAGANVYFDKVFPATWSVMFAIVWLIAGIALALYLGSSRPETLERATQAFGGEVEDDDSDNPDPHAHSMSISH